MAVCIDLVCLKCDREVIDGSSDDVGKKCPQKRCRGALTQLWRLTPSIAPGVHPSEACVVYMSQAEGGKIQYPGRNDAPVPARLVARGYERVVLGPREMGAFERKNGVMNERRHFDRNGRGLEG